MAGLLVNVFIWLIVEIILTVTPYLLVLAAIIFACVLVQRAFTGGLRHRNDGYAQGGARFAKPL